MTGVPSSTSISCSIFPNWLAGLIRLGILILEHPSHHRLAFPIPNLGGCDFLETGGLQPWLENVKTLVGLHEVEFHAAFIGKVSTVKLTNAGFVSVMWRASFSAQRPQLVESYITGDTKM